MAEATRQIASNSATALVIGLLGVYQTYQESSKTDVATSSAIAVQGYYTKLMEDVEKLSDKRQAEWRSELHDEMAASREACRAELSLSRDSCTEKIRLVRDLCER